MNVALVLQRLAVPVLLSALMGLLGVWGGYQMSDKRAAEEAVRTAIAHAEALEAANARARELEKRHEREVQDIRAMYARREAEARERDAAVIADLESGNRRLRLQVQSCSATRHTDPGAAPGGTDGAPYAELAPETASALWGIAADGDAYARRLEALQDWARSAVQLCGKGEQ